MNASIVGRYGFRRKSEQRQVALERAWLEVPSGRSDVTDSTLPEANSKSP